MTHRNVGIAFSELAQQEYAAVLRSLKHRKDRHRAVHEARKAIRRLRSVLALVGNDVGDQVEPLDDALKRLGDGLSSLRDAHVVIASAEKMKAETHHTLWGAMVERLTARRDALLDQAMARDLEFKKRQKRVQTLANALDQLPWAKVRKRSVEATLKQSEKRAEKARAKFEHDPKPALLHRWRRNVRRQRMQLQAWHRIVGAAGHHLHRQARMLAKRSDALGCRQDLQVLRSHVRRVAATEEQVHLMADIRAAMQRAGL